MLEPPERTICLYNSARVSTAALWIVFEEHLRDARLLDVDQMRLEHALGRLEAFGTNFDQSAIGQLYTRKIGHFMKSVSGERALTV
jgi:hypothetical protein